MHWFRDINWIVTSLLGTTLVKNMDYHFLSFQEFLIISQLGVRLADCLLPTCWDSVFWLAPLEVFQKQSMLVHMCPIVSKKSAVCLYSCLYFCILQSFLISLPPESRSLGRTAVIEMHHFSPLIVLSTLTNCGSLC